VSLAIKNIDYQAFNHYFIMTNYQKSEEVLKYQNRRPVDNFAVEPCQTKKGAMRPINNPAHCHTLQFIADTGHLFPTMNRGSQKIFVF